MTRFGKLFLGLLLLGLIALASMIRFRDIERASAPVPLPAAAATPSGLVIPVAGVAPAQLSDMFDDARDGHVHHALDIMAPRGTPVVAAMPGTVEKLFESGQGGITAYVRSPDRHWIAYYAHLDGYAPGLREGLYLQRGDRVGSVGSTGNASADGPHLHFALLRTAPGEAWHQGTPIDPYPLLAGR